MELASGWHGMYSLLCFLFPIFLAAFHSFPCFLSSIPSFTHPYMSAEGGKWSVLLMSHTCPLPFACVPYAFLFELVKRFR